MNFQKFSTLRVYSVTVNQFMNIVIDFIACNVGGIKMLICYTVYLVVSLLIMCHERMLVLHRFAQHSSAIELLNSNLIVYR